MLPEIIERVAEQTGIKRERITASTRLLHDAGMDGDDAVEFFTDFEKRYGADLTPLYLHWSRHFGPEGFGTPMGLLAMLLLVVAPVVLIPLGVSPMWGRGLELVAVVSRSLWHRRWPMKDDTIAITVGDLALAARSKQWPLAYDP